METRTANNDVQGSLVPDGSETAAPGCNSALIIGELATEPESRTLPGGGSLFGFSLRVRRPGEQTTSVPLIWYNPPKRVYRWKQGATIVASGPVVRRFFRAGGTTASRTEVTVTYADVLTQRARSRRILERFQRDIAAVVQRVSPPPD